jgi:hypothetical protein
MKARNHPSDQMFFKGVKRLFGVFFDIPPRLPPKGLKEFYLITTCEVTAFAQDKHKGYFEPIQLSRNSCLLQLSGTRSICF